MAKYTEEERNAIVESRFTLQTCSMETAAMINVLEANCQKMADNLLDVTPKCRELALALTALEDLQHWATVALVRTDESTGKERKEREYTP